MTTLNTPLDGARLFLESKRPVFPIVRGKKSPVIDAPNENASADPQTIANWSEEYRNCNWGYFPAHGGETVIDLDNHADKDGGKSLKDWMESLGQMLPRTFTVRTPSGGVHLYYKGVLPSSKDGFLPGVDVHSTEKYVIVPGSKTSKSKNTVAGTYTITDDREPAELPQWFIQEFNRTAPAKKKGAGKDVPTAPASGDDFSLILERILGLEPLQQGSRDNTLIKLCLDWKEQGMGKQARLNLLRVMNDLGKISPGDSPLTEEDFERLVNSSESKASAVFGSRTLEAMFGDAIEGAYSAADLTNMELNPPEFLIDGLIPKGLGFIAGPPKFGKTFLNLQLAVSLASGTPFLGRTVPKACRVLYFYLEGDAAQVKHRFHCLYGDRFSPPPNLIFAHKCPPLDAGGRVVMRQLMERYKPEFTIMDTWQLVREESAGKKGSNAYTNEYRELNQLREEVVMQYGTSVLLTHHTKQVSSRDYVDALNMLNGSTALSACSDYSVLLLGKRGDETFTLTAHGRSFEDVSIPLVRAKPMRWEVSADASTPLLVAETDLQKQIVSALRENRDGLTAAEIANKLGAGTKRDSVARQLNRWYEECKIDKVSRGKKFRLFETEKLDENKTTEKDNDSGASVLLQKESIS